MCLKWVCMHGYGMVWYDMAWHDASLTRSEETKCVTQIAMSGPERGGWAGCLHFPAKRLFSRQNRYFFQRQTNQTRGQRRRQVFSAQLAISRNVTKKSGLVVYQYSCIQNCGFCMFFDRIWVIINSISRSYRKKWSMFYMSQEIKAQFLLISIKVILQ